MRKPPHNLEAEQALHGGIMVDNRALDHVSSFLSSDHFFDPLHGRIYETLATLIHAGKTATPITVKTFFENAEPIDANLTVPQYLGRLAANATTIINAAEYGRTIYDLATRRSLIIIGEDMVNTAYDSAVDHAPRAQIEEAEGRLYSLAESVATPMVAAARKLRTLDDIKPQSSAAYHWKGVFGPGEVGSLFAISQAGKGFLLTHCSREHCLGRPVFGRPTKPSPILQVQYEGSRGLDKRIWAAAADLAPKERATFSRRYGWLSDAPPIGRGSAGDKGVAAIIAAARKLEARSKEPVGLIMIDTAAKAMPGESMNDDDAVVGTF